jgi:precorrin-6A/cobalt-precorrin-6A reductase
LTADRPHILLLAGTYEARQLARQIPERFPGIRVTASFAGVVTDLPDLGITTRIGGFGGADGLATFVKTENVTIILDATHPFAVQMSRNAADVANLLGCSLIRLERPAWNAEPTDPWLSVRSVEDAVQSLPSGARAFLAIGRKELPAFYKRRDIFGLARMIEPPPGPLPDGWSLVLSRPPQTVEEEKTLFKNHRISHVVTKNSGGSRSFAKIAAARQLKLPLIVIERPVLSAVETAGDNADTLCRLESLISD